MINKETILRLTKYIGIGLLSLFLTAFVLGGSVFLYYVAKSPALS